MPTVVVDRVATGLRMTREGLERNLVGVQRVVVRDAVGRSRHLEGGEAAIWRAGQDGEYAIKVFRYDAEDRAEPEFEKLQGLQPSRYVPKVYGLGRLVEGDGVEHPAIVEEYVHGMSLAEAISSGMLTGDARNERLGAAGAAAIVLELTRAVRELEKAGLAHRDISCNNVLLSDGCVSGGLAKGVDLRLLDFGTATDVARANATVLHTGARLATIPYGAPEMFGGDNYERRRLSDDLVMPGRNSSSTDVWSIGAIIVFLMWGEYWPEEIEDIHARQRTQRFVITASDAERIAKAKERPIDLTDLIKRIRPVEPEDREIAGLVRDCTKYEPILRATLDQIEFRLLKVIESSSGKPSEIRVSNSTPELSDDGSARIQDCPTLEAIPIHLESAKCYGRWGVPYTLGSLLGAGAGGEVFEVAGNSNIVAKIYYDSTFSNIPHVTNGRAYLFKKIVSMIRSNVSPYLDDDGNKTLAVTWPMDLLLDEHKRFVGYTMPRIGQRENLLTACAPSEQQRLRPDFSWKHSILIARNLAMDVEYLHNNDVIVGDFNMHNMLISPDCLVTMIHADAFNITDGRTGNVFKCVVGLPEFLAPELQCYEDLSQPEVVFTKASDCFSLAVQIWNLIMLGYDPYGSDSANWEKRSSSTNKPLLSIQNGLCPYISIPKGKRPSNAPNTQLLPDYLRDLFDRAFMYDANSATEQTTINRRPSAHEWRMALERLYAEHMIICSKNNRHVYRQGLGFASEYGGCPWCEREGRDAKDKSHNQVSDTEFNQDGFVEAIATRNTDVLSSGTFAIKRGSGSLFTSYILIGILFGVMTGGSYLTAFRTALPSIGEPAVTLIMSVLGVLVGGASAFFAQEKHQTADSAWTWPLLGLIIVPVATFIASEVLWIIGSVVVELVKALIKALIPFLVLVWFCYVCANADD